MCEQEGSGVAVAGVTPAPVVEAPPSQAAPLMAQQTEQGQQIERTTGDSVETLFLFRRSRFFDVASSATLKHKPGVVRRVICGSAPAGGDGVLTLRDGASGAGKVIAVIVPLVAAQPFSVELDTPFEKALSVVLVGATPGNFTVVWE